MTAEPRWVSKRALLLLHEESLAAFGGRSGLRDESLLESALARPQNLYSYHAKSTIADLAAAYGAGIARNHPFIDGNKRTAFLSIGLFLAINGFRLEADQPEAVTAMLGVASGLTDQDALSAWIASRMIRR